MVWSFLHSLKLLAQYLCKEVAYKEKYYMIGKWNYNRSYIYAIYQEDIMVNLTIILRICKLN